MTTRKKAESNNPKNASSEDLVEPENGLPLWEELPEELGEELGEELLVDGDDEVDFVPFQSEQSTSSAVPIAKPIPVDPKTAARAPESLQTLTSMTPPY
jgi:hypothetical protein